MMNTIDWQPIYFFALPSLLLVFTPHNFHFLSDQYHHNQIASQGKSFKTMTKCIFLDVGEIYRDPIQ